MIIIERLEQAMISAGITQSELARRVGVSPAAIQQILSGRTKRTKYLPDIAAALGATQEWLQGHIERDIGFRADSSSLPYSLIHLDGSSKGPGEQGLLVYADPRVFDIEDYPEDEYEQGEHRPAYEILVQNDSSMAPTIHKGDRVMIDVAHGRDDPGDIFFVQLNDGHAFRRVIYTVDLQIILVADNPLYPDQTLAPDADFSIKGKAIWIGHKLIP